jgi:hypothetical protein
MAVGGEKQMQFMIHWQSNDVAASIQAFLSGVSTPPEGITVLKHVHVVGSPEGFVLVETQEPARLNVALAALPAGVFDIQVYPVVDDADARFKP